ncbi:hypothetical protein RLOC_00002458 [Lonchura striata]|uniref:Uncharacterized protein n=1 Tax=Lonchura striata TaxID=40157 RepID=A0A218UWL8_9PASE|nr:hypothetical protein RLOC_00002458 [Lonchura striata domestica]
MDSPARNMKFQRRMGTSLLFTEFLLEGTAKMQAGSLQSCYIMVF